MDWCCALAMLWSRSPTLSMLSASICKNYSALSEEMLEEQGVVTIGKGNLSNDKANQAQPIVASVSASLFLVNPKLKEEVFGPYSLLVEADYEVQLQQVLDDLQGQLTASVVADETDLVKYKSLIQGITNIAGRVMLNNVPTGVEVLQAMQHGSLS